MAVEVLFVGGSVRFEPGASAAEAILVRGGRIAAVGAAAYVAPLATAGARRIDLDGAVVTAGFTDAHTHLTSWALRRERFSVEATDSIEAAAERTRAAPLDAGGWVRGHGWSLATWPREPHRRDLDRARSDAPVFLESHDLHAAWLNGEALRRCGIDRDTLDPPGGRVVRDDAGEPTGLLLENGRALALSRMPQPEGDEIQKALFSAQAAVHRLGITGVHSVEAAGLRDFAELHAGGRLRLRVLQHLQLSQLAAAVDLGLRSGFGDPFLRVGGIKMFLDGALGSRTAWMREPYLGSSAERGINTLPEEDFEEAARMAAQHGLATAVHAIGDAAVELALRTLVAIQPPPALPHRIEHLQLCPPDLWALAGASGIVASMQPSHLLSDIPAADEHWGHDRSRGAFPFAALERAGATLAFGSDVPVETIDPRPGLFAARCRASWTEYGRSVPPSEQWHPEHALDGSRALAGYTTGPAIAAGEADRRGRLLPGFDADLVVWSDDPIAIDPADYPRLVPLLTMVGGEIVFDGMGS